MFDPKNKYFKFKGPIYPEKTPQEFIPLLNRIKTLDEWENSGLKFRIDKEGNPLTIKRNGLYFGLDEIRQFNNDIISAINNNKILMSEGFEVELLLSRGCNINEFILQK